MSPKFWRLAFSVAAGAGILAVGAVLFENQRTIDGQRRMIESTAPAEPLGYDDVEQLNVALKEEFDAAMSDYRICREALLRLAEQHQLNDVKKALSDPEFHREFFEICSPRSARVMEENQ
jgi:hypothetical protein